jgi:flagellar basal-body rod protein FlgB
MVERPEVGDTIDGNAVDTDKEMARVADNSLYYQTQLELLRRRYAAVQKVITGMSGV